MDMQFPHQRATAIRGRRWWGPSRPWEIPGREEAQLLFQGDDRSRALHLQLGLGLLAEQQERWQRRSNGAVAGRASRAPAGACPATVMEEIWPDAATSNANC
jgi:hypothetical protein